MKQERDFSIIDYLTPSGRKRIRETKEQQREAEEQQREAQRLVREQQRYNTAVASFWEALSNFSEQIEEAKSKRERVELIHHEPKEIRNMYKPDPDYSMGRGRDRWSRWNKSRTTASVSLIAETGRIEIFTQEQHIEREEYRIFYEHQSLKYISNVTVRGSFKRIMVDIEAQQLIEFEAGSISGKSSDFDANRHRSPYEDKDTLDQNTRIIEAVTKTLRS